MSVVLSRVAAPLAADPHVLPPHHHRRVTPGLHVTPPALEAGHDAQDGLVELP